MIGCIFRLLLSIPLLVSIAAAGSLDIRLKRPANGHEYDISLSDSVGPVQLKADYAYGEIEDIITADKGSLELYYGRPLNSKWELWLFNITQYNNVYKTRENNFGAGPKYYIFDGDHQLSLSTGVLYQYDGHGRYSHRPKYSYKDWTSAVYFYQPTIEDSTDYIEKYKITATVPYTKRVGKIYCQKEYRSKIGVIEDECGLMVSIKFE